MLGVVRRVLETIGFATREKLLENVLHHYARATKPTVTPINTGYVWDQAEKTFAEAERLHNYFEGRLGDFMPAGFVVPQLPLPVDVWAKPAKKEKRMCSYCRSKRGSEANCRNCGAAASEIVL